MRGASEAIHSALYFYVQKYESSYMEWNWCPFCWRPAIDKSMLKRPERCALHKIGGREYRKVEYMLSKKGYKKVSRLTDRIPADIQNRVRELAREAFADEFSEKSSMFLYTINYLQNEGNLKIEKNDLENSLRLLTPSEDLIQESYIHKSKQFLDKFLTSLASPEELPANITIYEKQAMIIRAETWLNFMAEFCGHGGKRPNAGRPTKKVEPEFNQTKRNGL